jgi:hypothetical protein
LEQHAESKVSIERELADLLWFKEKWKCRKPDFKQRRIEIERTEKFVQELIKSMDSKRKGNELCQ